MTSFADENGKVHSFAYTGAGILKTDTNPLAVSASTRLSRSVDKSNFTVAVATPENRVTTHRVDFAPTTALFETLRIEERKHTDPMNLVTIDDHDSDGTRKITSPTALVRETSKTDPRFGFGAAFLASRTMTNGTAKEDPEAAETGPYELVIPGGGLPPTFMPAGGKVALASLPGRLSNRRGGGGSMNLVHTAFVLPREQPIFSRKSRHAEATS